MNKDIKENNPVRNNGSQSEPVSNGTGKSEAALREEKILEFWKENKVFEKSVNKKAPKGNYVFYDGPPFATGIPHYGHILGSTVKDVVGRYQTMQGFSVPRRWGWDCHGLPIENIVEKDLGISGRKGIEEYGVKNFVEYARSKVLTYVHEWKKTVDRMGRWVDFDNSYKTMDNTFIESVWWALGELNKKELLYEGVRVLAYCPRCETPIANSEIAMDNSYKDITDISVYVKFLLEGETNLFILAWTTTPWTLPGNTAIAINKNIKYVKVEHEGSFYIVAFERLKFIPTLKDVNFEEGKNLWSVDVESLIGKKYTPPFNYYLNTNLPNKENAWKIWHADFVTADAGTGVAHEAPAFGEDDMVLAKANNIPFIRHVEPNGFFSKEVVNFTGEKVKPKEDHQSGDVLIIKFLAHNGLLFAKEKIIHSYPHCYRCDTPLLYYALPSWFVNIQKVKKDLLEKAEEMNWIPTHLKDGRFHNIVENAPDWTISRNRYWASPLPIWKSESGNLMFVNSLEDLKSKTKKSGNKYFVMRHGGSVGNMKNVGSFVPGEENDALTDQGREQVKKQAQKLIKPDIIISSNFTRTVQTAEIVAEVFDISKDQIIINQELREATETKQDIQKRMLNVMRELERNYSGKTILIVSHEYPIRLLLATHDALDTTKEENDLNVNYPRVQNAEINKCNFLPLPRNDKGQVDLHRPYIDDIVLCDDKGDTYKRIPEVIDCWFESGSMPFAQDHFPFESKNWKKDNFPAGFVAEYIAQTRTWFYYTHAISTMLFDRAPFKNVVTTGTVLAEDGSKMSKSKNNFPDPWILFDKYGVDALRIYLMSSPLMKGEDVNFSERSVQEISSKIIGRLFNVLTFYELFRDVSLEGNMDGVKSENVLDQWIFSRFNQVESGLTLGMKTYDINEALKPLEGFIEDLSTWYLRRSRERIKDGDKEAKQTLYFVLKNLVKIMAPFAPFTAEEVWQRLKIDQDVESVHLAEWPEVSKGILDILGLRKDNLDVVEHMKLTREIVSLGLEARQKAKIPVRQPLSKLEVKNLDLSAEYLDLIKDELNVKELLENKNIEAGVLLDITITPALKAEGEYREFMRDVQDRRKQMGLNPGDKMPMTITDLYKKYKILKSLQEHMLRVAAVASMICDNFIEEMNKEEVITACLLHDIANIIKFDMTIFPKFFEPEGVEYWQNVKNEYIEKYGKDEHVATVQIAKEIGVSELAASFVAGVEFSLMFNHRDGYDFGNKIVVYADNRVSPHGVVPYLDRMEDARSRYKHLNTGQEEEHANLVACGGEIEAQIFAKCKIKPEDITDESVAHIIEELRGFVIK